MKTIMSAIVALTLVFAAPGAATAQETTLVTNTIKMTLSTGDVVIQLLPELAPNHVKRVQQLVQDGFYNGIVFHRVIPKFSWHSRAIRLGRAAAVQNILI